MEKNEVISSIKEIQKAINLVKNYIEKKTTGYTSIIRGLVCIIGCILTYFFQEYTTLIWLIVLLASGISNFIILSRKEQEVRSPFYIKFRIFWSSMIIFSLIFWFAFNLPKTHLLLYILLIFSMAFVLFGIWTSYWYTFTGLVGAVFSIIGWYFFRSYFPLWMAFFGGIGFFIPGFYLVFKRNNK